MAVCIWRRGPQPPTYGVEGAHTTVGSACMCVPWGSLGYHQPQEVATLETGPQSVAAAAARELAVVIDARDRKSHVGSSVKIRG